MDIQKAKKVASIKSVAAMGENQFWVVWDKLMGTYTTAHRLSGYDYEDVIAVYRDGDLHKVFDKKRFEEVSQ